MNEQNEKVSEGQALSEQPQAGDIVSVPVTQAPGRTLHMWPDVTVEGWPITVLFEIITPEAEAGPDAPNVFLMNGRPIAFTGEMKAEGRPGAKRPHLVRLPADWHFTDDGPSRAVLASEQERENAEAPASESAGAAPWRQVPAVLPSVPASFDFTVNKLAKNSVLNLSGKPLTWAKRVSLDIPAGGLSTLRIEGAYIEGIATGEAIPSLLLTCLARGDRRIFGEVTRATLPAVFDLLESRSEEIGADLIMGSCHIPTPEGPRLATFAVALTEPRLSRRDDAGTAQPFRLPETVDAQAEAEKSEAEAEKYRAAFNILASSVEAGHDEQSKAAVQVLRKALAQAGTARELRNSLPRLALEAVREVVREAVEAVQAATLGEDPGAGQVTEGQSEGLAPEVAPQVSEGEGKE